MRNWKDWNRGTASKGVVDDGGGGGCFCLLTNVSGTYAKHRLKLNISANQICLYDLWPVGITQYIVRLILEFVHECSGQSIIAQNNKQWTQCIVSFTRRMKPQAAQARLSRTHRNLCRTLMSAGEVWTIVGCHMGETHFLGFPWFSIVRIQHTGGFPQLLNSWNTEADPDVCFWCCSWVWGSMKQRLVDGLKIWHVSTTNEVQSHLMYSRVLPWATDCTMEVSTVVNDTHTHHPASVSVRDHSLYLFCKSRNHNGVSSWL